MALLSAGAAVVEVEEDAMILVAAPASEPKLAPWIESRSLTVAEPEAKLLLRSATSTLSREERLALLDDAISGADLPT